MGNEDGLRANRWRILGWTGVAVLLLIPAVAMRFTEEVAWTASDFVFAAVLLVGTGTLLEITVRRRPDRSYQAGAALALLAAFLMLWLIAAVGIIGDEGHPGNQLYLGLLAVVTLGSLLARFRPGGLALATLAGAVLQAAVAVTATVAGWAPAMEAALLNGFFVALWLSSSAAFRKAAQREARR